MKKRFNPLLVKKGKSKVLPVVCKRAMCSGCSTHSVTQYYNSKIVLKKKAS